MFSYLPLQSPLFIFIPLLIVIILAVLVIVFVLTGRLQLLRSQPRILSIQTVQEQQGIREQVESTTQQLIESQQQLEETHRQLADTRKQLEERQRQQEEALEQLAITREQLEDSRRQLVETQERLKASEEKLRAAQGKPPKGAPIGDELLNNKAWIELTEECVSLFDELDRKSATMDARRQELAGYVCSQLEEILERCGVTIISGDSAFDERRHRPYPAVSRVATGTVIAETLSPGFVVGPRVLRRARVRLAEETE